MGSFGGAFAGKTVLVTGHTGFKGSWLCLWLAELGAKVVGYALPPDTEPSLFEQLRLGSLVDSRLGDVRDPKELGRVVRETRPEIVFHLAAQALVRRSYDDPVGTFSTNVLGTAHLLEAVRAAGSVRACQVITSDKCYENRETGRSYEESDPLGGKDPYSASKAGAELVVASYRASYFPPEQASRHGLSLSSSRAGNVIGGGDWAADRILPDCIRALAKGRDILIRNPGAIRPWQHVLEPLSGYLWLCARQLEDPARFAGAWNFGPDDAGDVKVSDIADMVVARWGGGRWHGPEDGPEAPHEARTLRLDCSKARRLLPWSPVFTVREAVEETVAWYRAAQERGFDARGYSRARLEAYVSRAKAAGLAWA